MTIYSREKVIKKWFLKKLNGTITSTEQEELNKWIDENPRNKDLAERIFSEQFMAQAILDKNKQKQIDSWNKIYYSIGFSKTPRLKFSLWKWSAAAVVTGIIVLTSFLLLQKPVESILYAGSPKAELINSEFKIKLTDNQLDYIDYKNQFKIKASANGNKDISPNLFTTIKVPHGGEYKVLLDDNTLIYLNSGSSLVIPADYSPQNRSVNLSGEAFFEVHKDSLHPFTVCTERADIIVLGTRLNIEAYEDDNQTKVTLEQGKANIFNGRETVSLPVGEMAVINDKRDITIAKTNVYEQLAWHENRIVFENRPLEYIMQKLGRWYCFEVAYSNDKIRNMRITVDIDKHDTFNSLAGMLEKMNELQIQIINNKVLISEKK